MARTKSGLRSDRRIARVASHYLERLTAINRYPAPPFTNTDNLVAQVVSSGVIVKALVKAEKPTPVSRAIYPSRRSGPFHGPR